MNFVKLNNEDELFKYTNNKLKSKNRKENQYALRMLPIKNIENRKTKKINILGFDSETYRDDNFKAIPYNITIYGQLNKELANVVYDILKSSRGENYKWRNLKSGIKMVITKK